MKWERNYRETILTKLKKNQQKNCGNLLNHFRPNKAFEVLRLALHFHLQHEEALVKSNLTSFNANMFLTLT